MKICGIKCSAFGFGKYEGPTDVYLIVNKYNEIGLLRKLLMNLYFLYLFICLFHGCNLFPVSGNFLLFQNV